MPNRILKESICTSDTIDALSWFEEVFFYRLMVNVDDFGRFDARPAILKARLFPLKSGVTEKSVEQALDRLSTAGLVSTYTVEDKPILQLITWAKHQQIRNTKSKYPGPEEADLISTDINCNQLKSIAPVIQSNPKRNPNPKREENARPPKHKHGNYDNVLLTDTELETLKAEFSDWNERIERLSEYMASKGASYKNHLATIRAWARKDQTQPTGKRVGFQKYDQGAPIQHVGIDLLKEAREAQ